MSTVYTIVVAEDDSLMRGAVVNALSKSKSVSVVQFDNGADALSFVLSKKPELVMLDVALPKLDGISVLRKIREDEWGKDAAVILLTSLGDSEIVMKEVAKLNPAYCFMKDRVGIDEVVAKAYAILCVSA